MRVYRKDRLSGGYVPLPWDGGRQTHQARFTRAIVNHQRQVKPLSRRDGDFGSGQPRRQMLDSMRLPEFVVETPRAAEFEREALWFRLAIAPHGNESAAALVHTF